VYQSGLIGCGRKSSSGVIARFVISAKMGIHDRFAMLRSKIILLSTSVGSVFDHAAVP
jgi:hypothetical protein